MTFELAERLEHLRSIANLSARRTDSLAGLKQGHTRHIELGKRPHISADTIHKLASLFGVTMEWLFAGAGPAPSERTIRSAVRRAEAISNGVRATGTDG